MPRNCCVLGCNTKEKFMMFHRFPNPIKNTDLFKQWVSATGNNQLLLMKPHYIHQNYRICNSHFNEKTTGHMIPTLNQPDPIEVPTSWIGINYEEEGADVTVNVDKPEFWKTTYNWETMNIDASPRKRLSAKNDQAERALPSKTISFKDREGHCVAGPSSSLDPSIKEP